MPTRAACWKTVRSHSPRTPRCARRNVNGVAVPFSPNPRNTLYAFNFVGPAARLQVTRLRQELGPRLVQMTRELREAMKRSPGPRLAPPEIYEP